MKGLHQIKITITIKIIVNKICYYSFIKYIYIYIRYTKIIINNKITGTVSANSIFEGTDGAQSSSVNTFGLNGIITVFVKYLWLHQFFLF